MLEALALAANALAAAIGIAHAEAMPLSALPWASGAKDGQPCLAQLRGTPLDVQHWHVTTPTWAGQVAAAQKWVTNYARSAPAPVVLLSFALLPSGSKGQFRQCAAGQFDTYWQQIGTALSRIDSGHTVIVEPGWEPAIGSGSHPWGVDDISQADAYKACFRHASASLRLTFPMVEIAWSNNKIYRKNYTPDDLMPDPASFDYFGLLYYDNYRPLDSQATWDKYVNSHNGTGGSPSGIGSWLAYATAHGKKLGVSEWGLWDTALVTTRQADDPVYIRNMSQFFRDNSPSIAWETYQNNGKAGTDDHRLCPTTNFPDARDQYAVSFGPPVARSPSKPRPPKVP